MFTLYVFITCILITEGLTAVPSVLIRPPSVAPVEAAVSEVVVVVAAEDTLVVVVVAVGTLEVEDMETVMEDTVAARAVDIVVVVDKADMAVAVVSGPNPLLR
jgi:hypothetical protein